MVLNTDVDTKTEAGTIPQGVRQHAKAVQDDLRGLGRATMDAAQDKLTGATRMASDAEDQIEGYICKRPLRSILIATGVGVLAGFLLSRR